MIDKRLADPAVSIRLRAVKAVHTTVWAFFACCIIAIPIAAAAKYIQAAVWFALIVLVEILILFFNSWKCPLTAVAAQYTTNRAPNFDIYLPVWLARYNKVIFGSLYIAGIVFTGFQWVRLHKMLNRVNML